jgi:hypothetical protein
MKMLYGALVEFIMAKAATEQAKSIVLLKGCGYTLVEGEDGPEMVEVESSADEVEDEEPEGHVMGFTGKPKIKDAPSE